MEAYLVRFNVKFPLEGWDVTVRGKKKKCQRRLKESRGTRRKLYLRMVE